MFDEPPVALDISRDGAAAIISAALELLAEVEEHADIYMPDSLLEEARKLRAVVDEWIEPVYASEPS